MERISLQELEVLLTDSLTKFGMKTTKAHILARETVVKARKATEPKQRVSPAVLIEDAYRVSKYIRIQIKTGVKKDVKAILEDFLTGKKGYPPALTFEINKEFGGLDSLFTSYLATLKPKPKAEKKPRNIQQDILDHFGQLPKERQKEIVEALQAQV
ncbi:hypothetical protein LCGC14_1769090 [marine sediment metagenome]|uniref:Uncharacterized protein n=1 Tax=marine sediment metagenome TaxID=412755 RepID=A0A0F9GYS7_9ZZZZ